MVDGVCYLHIVYRMTYSSSGNQTFIVAIKTTVYFIRFFNGEATKFVSNIYALTNMTLRTTTPSAP